MTKQLSMTPHPFHIVGECDDCCDESEGLRLGFDAVWGGGIRQGCATPGCINNDEGEPRNDEG